MSFWIVATVIPVAAALVLCWPLLRQGGPWLGLGLSLLLLIPMATLLLYRGVGAPEGLTAAPIRAPDPVETGTDVDELLLQLRDRLAADPDNLEGWMLLGRSYKSLQRFDEALQALRSAQALAPDDPVVLTELAEAIIFTSPPETTAGEAVRLLETAVAARPDLQKGLWLLGMIAFQAGNDATALEHWERLMPLLQPGSGVADSVQQQVDAARARMADAPAGDWPGVTATVDAPPDFGPVPAGAALFVIARDPAAPRPPLGVVRVAAPAFPLEVRLDDGNSMIPQRPVSSVAEIEVLARLSLDGDPMPAPADPESEAVRLGTTEAPVAIKLQLAPKQP